MLAIFVEFFFNFHLIVKDYFDVIGIFLFLFFFLLKRAEDSPGGSSAANSVLESNGQKVSLVLIKVLFLIHELHHEFYHIFKALSLLSKTGLLE